MTAGRISAHFVTSGEWVVTSTARPPLLHDHPIAELDAESYSPPGEPALAARIVDAMVSQKLKARTDPHRGLDHGTCCSGPSARTAFGEGILILASGGDTHDQDEFRQRFARGGDASRDPPAWSVEYES